MNMFEQATRMKLRFETNKGCVSVEDLWDLPLQRANGVSLDGVAIQVSRKLKEAEQESFVSKPSRDTSEDQLRLEILKHIITVKMSEQKAAQEAADKRQQRQNIDALIAKKQQDEMAGKSLEELMVMREELN